VKTLIRLIQFVLSEIAELCSLISLTIMAIGFYTILPILVFFALLAFIFAGNWSWLLGVLIYVLIACAVFLIFKAIPEFLNFILGILLNERGENKKIYKNREKQYWKEKSQEYSYYRHQQEYSREQYERKNNGYSNFDYQSTNDGGIIQKFEEYLDILKIDKNGEINEDIIKKAYKKEIIKVHPDRNSDPDANAKTQKLNDIKEFLDNQLEYYLMQRRKRQ